MPVMLTDAEGRVSWQQQSQSLWGTITANLNLNTDTPVSQPLRFAGQYFDNETGLHYNTFRYYDPQSGRFTQPDPIGLLGGFNLYQYAPNPFSWIDPWGLTKCSPSKIVQKIIDNAQNGKVRRGKDYHGRLDQRLEQQILSNPESVYQAKNGNLIFHRGGDVVVTHGSGGAQGNVITSYGQSGPRGNSGAAIFGDSPSDPGLPITSDMIINGNIPRPDGTFIPPATKI